MATLTLTGLGGTIKSEYDNPTKPRSFPEIDCSRQYRVKVIEAVVRTSNAGNEGVSVKMAVTDAPDSTGSTDFKGSWIWDGMWLKGGSIAYAVTNLVAYATAAGIVLEGDTLDDSVLAAIEGTSWVVALKKSGEFINVVKKALDVGQDYDPSPSRPTSKPPMTVGINIPAPAGQPSVAIPSQVNPPQIAPPTVAPSQDTGVRLPGTQTPF